MTLQGLGRLLVVDDEKHLMDVLCEMLTEHGFETAGFTSSRKALEELKEHDFDLLLSDLMMPEMDGVTLLEAALEVDPSLVAIIMTGQGTVQTAVEAMKLGAFDYLLKPFKLNALLPVMSRAMQMRRVKLENLQLRETVAMSELIQAVGVTLDPETILQKVADAARQQCRADEVSIMLPTEDENELCVRVVQGEGTGDILGERVSIEKGVAGWVARHRTTLTLTGKVDDPRFAPVNPRDAIHSAVSMPMMVGNKLVGVLNVSSTNSRRPITVGQTKALAILANVAAPALESARLYREVQEAERRYRSIFENAVEGMFQTTPSGQIISANPAMARILGYQSPGELMASVTDLGTQVYVDPKVRAQFLAEIERRGLVQGFEAQMYRKDRSKICASIGGQAIRDSSGRIVQYEGRIEDVTERKQLEEQLVQSQKMEAIGTLAGGIAHDFNNLLTAIIGYSQLAASRLKEGDPMLKEIGEISKAGGRAAELTSQLLAFSRKQVLQLKVVNLNSIVENICKMIGRVIGEDIELISSLDPELGEIKADPGQMEQVIMNLAVNARDAMPQGGKLIIETGDIFLDDAYARLHLRVRPGPYVMMAVSDTGCGMDAETRSHIFDPFFTTKEPGKGTGLGLSTVYGIVKQSGGDIWVYSEPGRGTTFKLYLPRAQEKVEPLYRELHQVRSTGTETVLLVEDELQVRKLAAVVLRERGYEVLEASHGDEALRIAQQHPGRIHLLLTDVVMPQMSGKALSEQIKQTRLDIKVLFASGYTDDAVVLHGGLEADTEFIQKPFTPNTLANKVREVLDAGNTAGLPSECLSLAHKAAASESKGGT
jgi:PAS domain S-box-containing protein